MENQWLELSFPVPSEHADLISDELYAIGCLGVNIEERTLDTFTPPDPDAEIPSRYQIKAYFPQSSEPENVLEQIRELQQHYPDWEAINPQLRTVAQEDWAEGWKQHFSATRFGKRLVVKPTWEDWTPVGEDAVISLDPGMAFGTGSHETTRLCLQAIAELFDDASPQSLLDVGTGSGILAMAAAKLGATRILANDIDEDACRVARDNIELNRLEARIDITATALEDLTGTFDIVIANILAEENVRLASHLIARLNPGGTLLLSGILREKEAFVRQGFYDRGLSDASVTYDADWCCLHYRKLED